VDAIKARYKETKSERHKQMFAQIFCRGVVRRCRLEKYAINVMGIRSRRSVKVTNKEGFDGNTRERKCGAAAVAIKEAVQDFYERDDVSRCTTGKKETKTKGKVKKQKTASSGQIDVLIIMLVSCRPSIGAHSRT